MAIGGNPVGLSLGIVNEELNSYQDCLNNSLITVERHEDSCDYHKLSCRFLHHLNDSVAIKVIILITKPKSSPLNLQKIEYLHFRNITAVLRKLLKTQEEPRLTV